MRPPLIVHVHVPKSAGSSFRTLLQRRFGPDHANLYVDDTHFVYGESYLEEFISSRPSLRSISSHFIRTFPPRIAGREILYITFLRRPVEQFLSYLTYTRKHFYRIVDEGLLACLPPRAADLTLREMARWVLSRKVPFGENYVVNFFAEYHFRSIHPAHDDALYRATRLPLAKTMLQQFFFTGITERMDESIERLEQLGNYFDVEVPHGPIALENVSGEHRDDLAWIDASDEVGARLLASVVEDRELYEWGLARFEHVRFEQARAEKAGPPARSNPKECGGAPYLITQLYWSFADESFNQSQVVRRRWFVRSDDSPHRLDLPRFDRPPARLKLVLADRPIALRVSGISLLDIDDREVWRMRFEIPPERLSMAGIKLAADESIGGILATIEDSNPSILLPVETEALARLIREGPSRL